MPPTIRRRNYLAYQSDSRMDSGPHPLTHTEIDRHAPRSRGIYLLLRWADRVGWRVAYVGRDFRNIAVRLAEHVGEWQYTGFYFRKTVDRTDTYLAECGEFHRYGGVAHLKNEIHPSRPREYAGPPCSTQTCSCNGPTRRGPITRGGRTG